MRVYQLGSENEFIGAIEADEDPMEPGRFLIPAGCVTVAPPTVPAGERAVWNGSGWDRAEVEQPVAEPKPADAPEAEDRPPFEEPVRDDFEDPNNVELTYDERVNHERLIRFMNGCIVRLSKDTAVGILGNDETKTNLLGRVAAASILIARGDNAPSPWRDATDVVHMLTPRQFEALHVGSTRYVDALYVASWKLKELPPLDDVSESDLWPSQFIDMQDF